MRVEWRWASRWAGAGQRLTNCGTALKCFPCRPRMTNCLAQSAIPGTLSYYFMARARRNAVSISRWRTLISWLHWRYLKHFIRVRFSFLLCSGYQLTEMWFMRAINWPKSFCQCVKVRHRNKFKYGACGKPESEQRVINFFSACPFLLFAFVFRNIFTVIYAIALYFSRLFAFETVIYELNKTKLHR